MDRVEKAVCALAQCARPALLRRLATDSCIASTAVGVDVLTALGLLAEPLPVRTTIFNAPLCRRMALGQRATDKATLLRWQAEDGSHNIGIGFGTQQPGKWAGHLVILAEKKYLIDLSIDQANRPQYGVHLEPYYCEITEKFLLGRESCVTEQGGCLLRTLYQPNNLGFILLPDWAPNRDRKALVSEITALVEDLL